MGYKLGLVQLRVQIVSWLDLNHLEFSKGFYYLHGVGRKFCLVNVDEEVQKTEVVTKDVCVF